MKKSLVMLGAVALAGVAFAEGEGSFDPATLMTSAQSTVTAIATAVGSILVAAAGIYLSFLGWRKFRDATNKV